MNIHKVTFEDGLRLDDMKIQGITKYELNGDAYDVTTLKLELIVDDSNLFKATAYEFKPLKD